MLSIECQISLVRDDKREKRIGVFPFGNAPFFMPEKHENWDERLKKSYKLRYVAIKSIYISEKISKFALRTNKFLLIWKI